MIAVITGMSFMSSSLLATNKYGLPLF
jgi:hypothetical protein